MKTKIKSFIENSRPVISKIKLILFVVLCVVSSFFMGMIYKKMHTPKVKGIEMIHVNKSEVNLALDEHNNLLVIDKSTGNYTVYDDSIGVSIFKIYARNIKITE
jgi:hypothetical protein